jgi:AraC-like DNA-binding protein
MKKIILPEIVAVGVYNAQHIIKNRTVSPKRKTTMFEIEIPIGEGGVSYIDNTSHAITENLVICAKPGQMRHTRLPFMCYYIHIIINEGQIFDILSALPNYIELEDSGELRELFGDLCAHYDSATSENEMLLQSLILRLIYLLNRYSVLSKTAYTPKTNNRALIERTLSYIKDNLTSDLSLKKLADEANFSSIYFHKVFKNSTGKTLHQYVEDQKIKKSIDLLISTDMTLTQIAYECGFSSQSYFSYAFKKKTGQTPREYVKNIYSKYEKNTQ